MRKLTSLLLCFLVLGCASGPSKTSPPKGKPVAFMVRPFTTEVLPNGLSVLWIEDAALPYVSFQTLVKAGSAQDPLNKEGLAMFTTALLDKGAGSRSAPQLAEQLEQAGSSFDFDVQPDYTMAYASALAHTKDKVLELYRDILVKPKFPQAEIERHRQLTLAGLKKMADRPGEFADFVSPSFLFGTHPYGHSPIGKAANIQAFTRADVERFYRDVFVPNNAMLAVVGQFDEAFKAKVREAFAGWKDHVVAHAQVPEVQRWEGQEVLLVDRADLNQAQIRILGVGIPRAIPEFMDLRAAMIVLGDSTLGSRLFEEIRIRRGLTYGINSSLDGRMQSGPFTISTFTRAEKVRETVEETLNVYRKFVQDGVSEEEANDARAYMRGQFPRMFETPEALARQLLLLNRFGVSTDYVQNYMVNLENVSRASINAAVKKYLDPKNVRILVYAPRKVAEPSLSGMGKVTVKPFASW